MFSSRQLLTKRGGSIPKDVPRQTHPLAQPRAGGSTITLHPPVGFQTNPTLLQRYTIYSRSDPKATNKNKNHHNTS